MRKERLTEAGLEPATLRLLYQCSTNWAIQSYTPKYTPNTPQIHPKYTPNTPQIHPKYTHPVMAQPYRPVISQHFLQIYLCLKMVFSHHQGKKEVTSRRVRALSSGPKEDPDPLPIFQDLLFLSNHTSDVSDTEKGLATCNNKNLSTWPTQLQLSWKDLILLVNLCCLIDVVYWSVVNNFVQKLKGAFVTHAYTHSFASKRGWPSICHIIKSIKIGTSLFDFTTHSNHLNSSKFDSACCKLWCTCRNSTASLWN